MMALVTFVDGLFLPKQMETRRIDMNIKDKSENIFITKRQEYWKNDNPNK